ncbi:MAG: tripartite tricarboxylate transporter permease [Candidatus Pacearchaeota archaeon]
MLEIILAIFLGIFCGIIAGLLPGIHTNLLAVLLLSISPLFLNYLSPLFIIVLIVSMGITNTFIDSIPSIYLGAPEEDSALSVLPGHKMLLDGRGHEAVIMTIIGSLIAIVIFTFVSLLSFFFSLKFLLGIEKFIPLLLFWVFIFLLIQEKNKKVSFIFFLLSGILGISSFNLSINQPLLPLLTGLFGTSTLIFSIYSNSKPPKQKIRKIKFSFRYIKRPLLSSLFISPLFSFLPGVGASQAAITGCSFFKRFSKKEFLILVGSTNTLILSFSFLFLYLFNKKRSGLASVISEITKISFSSFLIIFFTIIFVSILASILTLEISKFFAKRIHSFNYRKLSFSTFFFIVFVVFLVSGFKGILVLFVSTTLGFLSSLLGVKKSFLMGCLMIPTMLWYFPF